MIGTRESFRAPIFVLSAVALLAILGCGRSEGQKFARRAPATAAPAQSAIGAITTQSSLLERAAAEPMAAEQDKFNTESYDRIDENPFLDVRQNPLSTFSIDVDTASYANVRRFLNSGSLPPKDAVRIEELVNYFTYHYAPPGDDKPFAVHAEVAGCPWEPKHRLLRIALKGREIELENRPASNLVFLIDVSGSMDDPAKLPLLKSALHLLVDKLGENDRVAMVVYAGSSGLVLPSTSGLYKETILAALDQLQAGGSTNGGSGIQLAYQVARDKFIRGGTNRVILCTDGDFNVGVTDQGSLTRLIEDEAKSGVFLSVLGFGAGNLKDSTMEQLADRGNGNYAYIDTINEGRKVLVEQLGGTLVTIAKDVKLQLEFNPQQVAAYRLIGYENRLLRAEDFNDDKKDAGEIGAGHTVTALYELVPAGSESLTSKADELKYQRTTETTKAAASDELLTLKLRYKEPDGDTSKLSETVVKDTNESYARASEDYRFASSVAGFGLLLRDSQFKGDLTWGAVLELAEASRGVDENGYRTEFIDLVKKAKSINCR
jgi:Ca-activated chloride channel homolog